MNTLNERELSVFTVLVCVLVACVYVVCIEDHVLGIDSYQNSLYNVSVGSA